MGNFEDLLQKYDYALPKDLIAKQPASPRDSAGLLVYDRKAKKAYFDKFRNLDRYMPKNAVIVLNETKVLPARITVTKPTGGKARLLYISHDKKQITALSDRKLVLGSTLSLDKTRRLTVAGQKENFYVLTPNFPAGKLLGALNDLGTTPLPPYIKNTPLSESALRKKYQTLFAKRGASIAAPTASLHFTQRLMDKLRRNGAELLFVNLNVGLGTFAPLKEINVTSSRLHEETFSISRRAAERINKAKAQGRPIVAVGTTVVRTLESAADKNGRITKLKGSTGLFIREGYCFKSADALVTNFHVPKSSLLMLVSAFAGRKTVMDLYRKAILKKMRFYSFGDGMLIL